METTNNNIKHHSAGCEHCNLPTDTPYAIYNVTMTQFSIARYYGGIKINGKPYTYFQDTDELVRDDVLAHLKKHNKKHSKPTKSQDLQSCFKELGL